MALFKNFIGWLTSPEGDDGVVRHQHPGFTMGGVNQERPDLAILVSAIDGPNANELQNRIADAFLKCEGVSVSKINKVLKPASGREGIDGLMSAAEQGRELLAKEGAEVIVWGLVEGTGRTVSLRFLPANPPPDGRPGSIGLGDSLDIPARLPAEYEDIVVGVGLAAPGAIRTAIRDRMKRLLADYADRADRFVSTLPNGLEGDSRASVLAAAANVIASDGRVNERTERYRRAIDLYRLAHESLGRDTPGTKIALIQSHLATTLMALSSSADNQGAIAEAVDAYRLAADSLQRGRHSQDWALAHMRLGLTIYRQALVTGRAKLMREAVEALDKSLQVFTKVSSPGKWAEIMNHIGVVMTALGEELTNDTTLERAILVFKDSLSVRERDVVPTLWAQTTNNLGAAAFALGKRRANVGLLDQATIAFRGAIEVYRELGETRRVSVIESNLDRVQDVRAQILARGAQTPQGAGGGASAAPSNKTTQAQTKKAGKIEPVAKTRNKRDASGVPVSMGSRRRPTPH
ncbi:MAG: hypothetical protein RIC16_16990 [Rhodospirillales bacterium]